MAAARNSAEEKRGQKGRVRLLRARGSTEFGEVATSSTTQGLCLGDRKVRSQVIGENQSRLHRRGTVGKVRKRGKRASDRRKKTVQRFRVKFGKERIASRLPCLSFGLGDDRRSMSGSRDVSQTIFLTSVSGSKSLTSFTNRFFNFSIPPKFRMASDAAERGERFGRIQCQRSKDSSSSEINREEYFSSEGQ